MKNVWISVDNQKLKGTLFFPKSVKEKNPAILFIHGWTSDETGYQPRAEGLAELGFICLTFDLRGHGQSEGELQDFSRKDHLKDVMKAFDFLVSQNNVDKERIGVVGASYGGYLASLLTTKRNIKWLALRAPAIYPNERFDEPTAKFREEKLKEIMRCRFNKVEIDENLDLNSISQFKGDILLIESETDDIVPHQTIENYINAVSNKNLLTHKVIKEAGHVLFKEEWKKEFIDILVDWFKEKI